MKIRCQVHDRTFSEAFDASFHETLNAGCRWEKVERSEEKRRPHDRIWVVLAILFSWFTLALFLSLVR